jgi:hypothetical protein
MTLTLDRLKQVVSYNPETGIFTWVKPASNRVKRRHHEGCTL